MPVSEDAVHAALKDEIKSELRTEARRRKLIGCGVLLLVLLALMAIPAGAALYIAAKTGFARVPVLTKRVYMPPGPLRVVQPLAGSDATTVMRVVGASTAYDFRTGLATLSFNEAQLTTLAAAAAAASDATQFPVSHAQALVEPGYVEVHFETPHGDRMIPIRIRVKPSAAAGAVSFEPIEAYVGAATVPPALLRPLFDAVAGAFTDAAKKQIEAIGEIDDIVLERGMLRLRIRPQGGKLTQ